MATFQQGSAGYRINNILAGVADSDVAIVGQIAALARAGVDLQITDNGNDTFTFTWFEDGETTASSVTVTTGGGGGGDGDPYTLAANRSIAFDRTVHGMETECEGFIQPFVYDVDTTDFTVAISSGTVQVTFPNMLNGVAFAVADEFDIDDYIIFKAGVEQTNAIGIVSNHHTCTEPYGLPSIHLLR